jgi:peptidoglycan lytic transglycosylase G
MRLSIFGVFKTVILLAILGSLCVGGYAAYTRVPGILNNLASVPPASRSSALPGEQVVVEIPKGVSLSQVGKILEDRGIISSRLVFKLVAMIRGEQRKIQAGEYLLETGSDAGNVLDQLISGKTRSFPITVPEGYTQFQVAALFEQLGLMQRSDFLNLAGDKKFLKAQGIGGPSLEGYLFPDTYFLKSSERKDGKALVSRMIKRFHEVYDKHVRPTAKQYGWDTHRVVTLASLIEKEAKATEHALVSSVFHNRLRKNWKLQSDPTVIYGIKPMGAKITRKDLKRKHPYNTYENPGLPPGPIANPGKASLIAAVKPAPSDYFYFVAKNDGTHHFSKSLKEHNRNVDLYQRRPKGNKAKHAQSGR